MTQRATSFIVVSGRLGHRRVSITCPTGSKKTKTDSNVVWVDFSEFMKAVNATGGPTEVTLAGIPCRFTPRGKLLRVVRKKKAIHGVGHGPNGRIKYSRTQVHNCY